MLGFELIILDIIGTIAFSVSGYIISAKSDYDILGIFIITFTSAFGGGIIRDLILNKTPFIFISSYPLIVSSTVIILSFLLKYHHKENLEKNKLFILADTIGLSSFAYTGAIAGVLASLNIGGIIFLSLITSIGGGIIRDVLMNKEVYSLKYGFYGSVAVLMGFMIGILNILGFIVYSPIVIIIGIILRYLAIYYKWKLPKLK